MLNKKFILVSQIDNPNVGTFVYGLVNQHEDLLVTFSEVVHGGGWWHKDDVKKEMTLYGRSVDFGEPDLNYLNRIPKELLGYTFLYAPDWGEDENTLSLKYVEWF